MTATESFWSPQGPAMSSVRTDWNTPQNIVDLVHEFFGGPPAVDPCSNPNSIVGAKYDYMLERDEDGLAADWGDTFFINPPFGSVILSWAEMAWQKAMRGAVGLSLTPARVDTKWGQYVLSHAQQICFLRGRLKFLGAPSPAPFPCMVALWAREDGVQHPFREVFDEHGVCFGEVVS